MGEDQMLAELQKFYKWILGIAVAILGIIFLTKRSGQGHEQSATRSAAGAEEHEAMADIALEAAKSEAKTAESHHLDAEQAATAEEPITIRDIPSVVLLFPASSACFGM
jgi:hypothetical protein